MGSIPEFSIIKGRNKSFEKRKLHRIFEEHLEQTKGHNDVAIIFKENMNTTNTTYGEYNEASNKLARSMLKIIHENKIPVNNDGDYVIAVSMQPSDRLLIALLAIWKCGAAYLPIDPTFPEMRVKHIQKEALPVLVIYDETSKTEYFDGSHSISFTELMEKSKANSSTNLSELETLTQSTENLAIVLYTSGSTGIPKGVRLPHDIIMNRLQWQFDKFPYSQTEKVCVFKTALTFVDSVCEIWGPLLNGLCILVIPKSITRDPQKLVEELNAYKIERLVLVPSLLRSLLLYLSINNDKNSLNYLRLWVSSGEPLSVSLAKDFFDYFSACKNHVLCNFYGSTEVMGDVTYFAMENKDSLKDLEKIPIGNPLDNTIIYLLDENLQPVPKGQPGELWVSGSNLATGYVNGRDPDRFILNPLAQNAVFSKIYRTGDFAKFEKGTLFYEGRTDSQIKIRGHRVDLSEVEKAVLANDGVEKGVVLCYKPGEMDQALLAFITINTNSKITGMKIERLLQDKLAAYMIPQVIILENIPLLVNGKVDRQSLLKMYENTNNNDDTEITLDFDYSGIPSSKMEAAETLFKTVGTVIGRSTRNTVSVKSNYYELGGNSLNSIFTISQLKDKGYAIGITDFIMANNLGEILDMICPEQTNANNSSQKKKVVRYSSMPLENKYKNDCLRMIVSSFYEKAELEQLIKDRIQENDYRDLLDLTWDALVEKDLSFVVTSENNQIVAVAFNFDVRDEPEVEIDRGLKIIFEFLEHLEGPMRDQHLPQDKGQIVHSFMMATHADLTSQENVAVIKFMEEELVSHSRKKGYTGIFTTNTSPLTQQLGTDVMGYETLLNYQINKYITSEGDAPFSKAPDSQLAVVCWKKIA